MENNQVLEVDLLLRIFEFNYILSCGWWEDSLNTYIYELEVGGFDFGLDNKGTKCKIKK